MMPFARTLALFVLAAFLIAPAEARVALSVAGVDLGRVQRSTWSGEINVVVGNDAWPQQGFIVARFQNNQPLMKSADGSWTPWDGDFATLEFVNIAPNDGALRFGVGEWPTADVLAPCTFTVGYRAEDGLKFGYLTVDGL
jgi:hypothetical protein